MAIGRSSDSSGRPNHLRPRCCSSPTRVQRASAPGVEILLETTIDALDITVLKGGGDDVGAWAADHGFRLPPDAPEVLDFYAQRSPIFLAAAFDADAAVERGQAIGDGTPVHVTIPTDAPWVPLRILSLGKSANDRVDADVYLLTDRTPTLLPAATGDGLVLDHTAPASTSLLDDLRSDRGMEWVPDSAWLMKVRVDSRAADLSYDLAVDATGRGMASRIAAGLDRPADAPQPPTQAIAVAACPVSRAGQRGRGRGMVSPCPPGAAAGRIADPGEGHSMRLVRGLSLPLGVALGDPRVRSAVVPASRRTTVTIGIHYSHFDPRGRLGARRGARHIRASQ